MMDWVWKKYEYYKASLISYLANFFALGTKILQLRDRADRVYEKARRTGDPALIRAAEGLRVQAVQLVADHQAATTKVLAARDSIGQVEATKGGAGLGALPLAALGAAAAVIITAISAVLVVFKKYDYLNRAMDGLERKTLSPGEYAAATGAGASMFGGGGMGTLLLVGGAVAVGYMLLKKRR